MESANVTASRRVPWKKGKLTGQKPPLKLREIWAIRTRLQMASLAIRRDMCPRVRVQWAKQ